MGFAIGFLFLIFGGGYYLIRFLVEGFNNASSEGRVRREVARCKEFATMCEEKGVMSYWDAYMGKDLNSIHIPDQDKMSYHMLGKKRGEYMLEVADRIKARGISTKVYVRNCKGDLRYLTKEHPFENGDERYVFEQTLSEWDMKKTIRDTYPDQEKPKDRGNYVW